MPRHVTCDLTFPFFAKLPDELFGLSRFQSERIAAIVFHIRHFFRHFSVLALLFGVPDRKLVPDLPCIGHDEAHGLSRLYGELFWGVAHGIQRLQSDRAGHSARFAGLTST